jgi:hypothetical protein
MHIPWSFQQSHEYQTRRLPKGELDERVKYTAVDVEVVDNISRVRRSVDLTSKSFSCSISGIHI